MENYNIKVIITSSTGQLIEEEDFNTAQMAELKAFGGTSIVDDFIRTTLDKIQEKRKDSPHHHTNRLD